MIDQWLQWSVIPWLDAVVQVAAGMPLVDAIAAPKLQMEISELALDNAEGKNRKSLAGASRLYLHLLCHLLALNF